MKDLSSEVMSARRMGFYKVKPYKIAMFEGQKQSNTTISNGLNQ